MVDNGLGLTFVPGMAIQTGILQGTKVDAKQLESAHGFRRVALIWRRSSPRENEFQLLAATLRRIARDLIPDLEILAPPKGEEALEGACG
jgi:LysR family hydrogen peroxide-inducible transcriptional activator